MALNDANILFMVFCSSMVFAFESNVWYIICVDFQYIQSNDFDLIECVSFKCKCLYFADSYLPRVVELALSSSNRQTKVVACELLHALVLYMIGKSIPERSRQRVSWMEDRLVLEIWQTT